MKFLDLQLFGTDSIIKRGYAEALMPEEVSKEIVQGIPEYSAIMQLATKAPNMSRKKKRIPVLSALPTAYFVDGDTGLKQTSEAKWGNKYFDAEELAVIIPIPEAVLDDVDYDIWGEIKPRIMEAMGVAFDNAVLFGVNKPASWPEGLFQQALAAKNIVAINTGSDLYDDLLGESGVISLVEQDGFMVTGHIADMGMRGKYRGLRDKQGQPIFKNSMQQSSQYDLDGSPIFFPRNGVMKTVVPSAAPLNKDLNVLQFAGDFKQVLYALRQDITYKILDQAVIQDNTGKIVYNLAQQDMVALRAVMRLAWQVPNPINRMQADEKDRFPVAALYKPTV